MAAFSIPVKNLAKGLRPSARMKIDNGHLVTCSGMVGKDGVLQAMDELTPLPIYPMEVIGTDGLNYTCIVDHVGGATNVPVTGASWATYWTQTGSGGVTWVGGTSYLKRITFAFPYPQIFVFDRMIIVCGETTIYEWVSSALVSKLTVTAGTTWRALQFSDFVYMSNGKVSVTRDPQTKAYSLSDQPVASALCNYGGQVIIGAPGVEVA